MFCFVMLCFVDLPQKVEFWVWVLLKSCIHSFHIRFSSFSFGDFRFFFFVFFFGIWVWVWVLNDLILLILFG